MAVGPKEGSGMGDGLPCLSWGGGVGGCIGVCSDQEYLLPGGILGIPTAKFVWASRIQHQVDRIGALRGGATPDNRGGE